ncbi:NAD(P)/FAD-dependent oxidoreductase [Pseudomonas sp. 21LCFQ010]|uniref:NAD(P)/FAD-dependent oxidoreductase n=1 Tax=Pseudomonas sp. 21LCFQ010 TaxID=2957506 RepID=UPI00209709C3|nr:NAD(P)/FAD-dependent oxidoreductase [Pseudomonas sp. 21LCFQ010]MCO8163469.1 NAD(P)/FAD-dependent oxidoreductase [Pseudomonas sp. 21LCFQ010]
MTGSVDETIPCFDVVIIGGGPAGTSAALTLLKRTDISVLVVEAGHYDRPKSGESLSPGVRNLLDYLAVWDDFAGMAPLQTWGNQAAWGSEQLASFDFMFNVHGHGWAIDRARFEHMMARLVSQRGGRLECDTRCLAVRQLMPDRDQYDGWQLTLRSSDDREHAVRARVVIDAAGRTSRWNEALHHRHDDLVGVSALLTASATHSPAALTTVETVANGWWYAAPVPGGRVAVSFMSDSDIIHQNKLSRPENWLTALAGTRHIAELINPAESDVELRTDPAFSACLVPGSGGGIIPAGDAAASFDPLSSGGIPHALATGIQAARAASDRLHGEGLLISAYETAIAADFRQYLRTRWRIYGMETRFGTSPFWVRRQTPVSLPPENILIADSHTDSQTIFLPRQVADLIRHTAIKPISAAELIGKVGASCPAYPAERLILGVQDMIGKGLASYPLSA